MSSAELLDDYDEIIHYDARNGYSTSLKTYLEHKPECVNKLYQYGQSKWSVLLAACYYQQETIVRMLITHFGADVEAKGTIIMDDLSDSPEIIENASPLWTAASVNNFNIVKFLVEYALANVNHLTKTHSSPIRAACYNGNLEMVKYLIQLGANPHQARLGNDTNLMLIVSKQFIDLVVYFVDEIRCDLNQQDENGKTALHFAVEHSSIEITRILISRGALNLRDQSRNMTPLMFAAIHGKSDFVAAFDGHCSDLEWIEAMELHGSAFAGCEIVIEDLNFAVECWTSAFEARAAKKLPKLLCAQASKVFDNRRECETLQELNQLVSSDSIEALYIEALLIRERILGTISIDYRSSLRLIGKILAGRHRYDACLRLWFYELNLRQQHSILFNKQDLRSFVSLFDDMLSINYTQTLIDNMRKMLTIMIDELPSVQSNEDINYNLVTLLYLVTISAQMLFNKDIVEGHKLPMDDRRGLFQHIRSIVQKKYDTTGLGSSLLHLCCDGNTESLEIVFSYPCMMTVHLLVLCGVDVDAMDSVRNTALHILVRNSMIDESMAIIDYLCDEVGAHMDFADNEGNPPHEYTIGKTYHIHTHTMKKRLRQKIGVTSLKCRCARLVKQGRLPYQKFLSSSLVNFVYKH